MTTADDIRAHTSAVLRARAAYNADQAVTEGRFAQCGRPHNEKTRHGNPERRCQSCRKGKI